MGSDSDSLVLTGKAPTQKPNKFTFRNVLLTKSSSRATDSESSMSRIRGLRMNTISASTRAPVLKLKSRKLMTVATNIATVARLGNPFRLSSCGNQVLLRNKFAGDNEHKDNDRCREEDNEHS